VRWTLVGASEVAPLSGEAVPGRLVYPEVYPGVKLTLEPRRHGFAYRFDLAPGADAGAIRMRYEGADEIVGDDGGRALRVRVGNRWLREDGLRCFQEEGSRARTAVPCRYVTKAPAEVLVALGSYDRQRPLVIDPEIGWSSYLGGGNIDEGRGVAADGTGNVYVVGQTFSSDFPASGAFDSTLDGNLDAFVAKIAAGGGSLEWAAYLGGSADEHGHAMATDTSGDVYVTGDTESSDFPVVGGFDATLAGVPDAYVAKITAAGVLEWSSYLGGDQPDEGFAIAVDSTTGEACVTGHTLSSDYPTLGGFDSILDGGDDAFVTRVAANGASLVWSSFLGGNSDDIGKAIAVDAIGDIYVAGRTISPDFPTDGGFDDTPDGNAEAFVAKITAAGTLAWSSFLGGIGSDEARGIAVDAAGEVYVTGQTGSVNFPTTGGFDDALAGSLDAFLVKVSASGSSLAWGTYLGGSDEDSGYAVVVDSGGVAYLAGDTSSSDFPATDGFDQTLDGATDAFVAKVDSSGAILDWASYLGGGRSESGRALALTADGSLVVTGKTPSEDLPTTGGFDTTLGGSSDAFVALVVVCGNGVCEIGEDACNCPDDCGADACGNGCCGPAESECDCPADCGPACGDGCCGASESPCDCPDDCGADACGNGCCGPTESECDCPEDCDPACGDGCCGATETACDCPEDCGEDECGNGCCGSGEDSTSCPGDCPTQCGDGVCESGEDRCTCPEDCMVDECNDGCCGPGETACTCPDDCAHVCGDGCCRGGETCDSCVDDCGECPPGIERKDPPACSCELGGAPGGVSMLPWLALLLIGLRRRG